VHALNPEAEPLIPTSGDSDVSHSEDRHDEL
jgi:hypothetical protein